MDRWATFDCYGTLIDWRTGISRELGDLWPNESRDRLLADYLAVEPRVQAERDLHYREVMRRATEAVAVIEGLRVPAGREEALAESLPDWPPFADVAPALEALRVNGWKLAILSNTDPDLLASSVAAIGIRFDLLITAAEAGSYKPAAGHWQRFRSTLGSDPDRHVHVAASLFHDVAPCAKLGIDCVWINRLKQTSDLPRLAEIPDLTDLPQVLDLS